MITETKGKLAASGPHVVPSSTRSFAGAAGLRTIVCDNGI
jgi:hypothetical protein